MTATPDQQRHSLMPIDTPDYMIDAWASCMSWALGNNEIRATFETETGNHFTPPKNSFDAMIDESTGYGKAYVKAFVLWANENVWGRLDRDQQESA